LTQAAYLERRSTLSNNGVTPSGPNPFDYRKGKFFPRGCRGFIQSVELYLKGAAGAVTVTVSFRVHPEGGEVFNVSYVLGASAAEGWKTIAVNSMWNYDSMFVVCYSADTTSSVGFEDSGTPYDAYFASPGTEEYSTVANVRFWYRVVMIGQTIGDLPVSGTVNTVALPRSASQLTGNVASIPDGAETSILTIAGAGILVQAEISFGSTTAPSASVVYSMWLYADGVLAAIVGNRQITQSQTATSGRCAIGELYPTPSRTSLTVRLPIEFLRSLEIKGYQTTGGAISGDAYVTTNIIK
jgi:hypothetical protein